MSLGHFMLTSSLERSQLHGWVAHSPSFSLFPWGAEQCTGIPSILPACCCHLAAFCYVLLQCTHMHKNILFIHLELFHLVPRPTPAFTPQFLCQLFPFKINFTNLSLISCASTSASLSIWHLSVCPGPSRRPCSCIFAGQKSEWVNKWFKAVLGNQKGASCSLWTSDFSLIVKVTWSKTEHL